MQVQCTPTSSPEYLQRLRDRLRALANGTRRRETSSHGELQRLFFSRYLDSHWLLIDSNRNYQADVVGSWYNRFFFLASSSSFLILAAFFLLFIALPRFQNTYIVQLSPRDPHATRDILPTCIHRTLVHQHYTSLKESGVNIDWLYNRRSSKMNNFLKESVSNMFDFK